MVQEKKEMRLILSFCFLIIQIFNLPHLIVIPADCSALHAASKAFLSLAQFWRSRRSLCIDGAEILVDARRVSRI